MLDADAIRSIRPFIATPSHSGLLTSGYVRSLLALSNAAWTQGFSLVTRLLDGDALITRARNELVAEFMADPRWTHLFWIDADLAFEPDAALRLMRSGKDVVAGVCPRKFDGWPAAGLPEPLPAGAVQRDFEARFAQFNFNPLPGPQTVDVDGFVPVKDIGTGFMLIARRVFEQLAEHYPTLRYEPTGVHDGRTRHRFFDVGIDPDTRAYLSEDFAFCRRWRAIGGQVFADTQSNLQHIGSKAYGGDFQRVLQVRQAFQPPAG